MAVDKRNFRYGLINGDCLAILPTLPQAQKFDVIIADPPYNIGKDFGNDSDKQELADYVTWATKWIALCRDLLTNNGILYIYGLPEILAQIATNYPIHEQRWLVWHYTNKTAPAAKFWQRSHESILCLWHPEQNRPQLAINQIREPYTTGFKSNIGKTRAKTASRFNQGKGRATVYKDFGGALPRDVIKVPALAGGAGATERWFLCQTCNQKVYPPNKSKEHRGHVIVKHPTQKPQALTKKLLQSKITHTGSCLIPFAGSGSECVVATQLEINYLGIELNPQYYQLAKQWLRQTEIRRHFLEGISNNSTQITQLVIA